MDEDKLPEFNGLAELAAQELIEGLVQEAIENGESPSEAIKKAIGVIDSHNAFAFSADLAGIADKWGDITPEQVTHLVAVLDDTDLRNERIMAFLLIMTIKAIAIGAERPQELAQAALRFFLAPNEEIEELLGDIGQ